MIRSPFHIAGVVLACLAWPAVDVFAQPGPARPLKLTVQAGGFDRDRTPIGFELAEDRLEPPAREALDKGPIALALLAIPAKSTDRAEPVGIVQVERDLATRRIVARFILPGRLARGEAARFEIGGQVDGRSGTPGPWSFDQPKPGALDLKFHDRPVFRYNAAPVSSPNYKEIQNRDAYLHPAYAPSGALITGDFSSSHPHHRGFFLAYEKTKSGDLAPDFWNIHYGTGKIYSEGFEKLGVGPISARFSTKHRWDAKEKSTGKDVTVLREHWDVEAYAIPGAEFWLFDITSTQQAVGQPLELLPYRYGGMAYRGPEPFVKGMLDVLTSEGLHRKDGDQKLARWVDLSGPVSDGSDRYAGAMIADHPANPNSPTVARIHPTTLPFFCFVPAHDKPLTIAVEAPTVFRYRVLIHDGRPDRELDERVARDFAEPPVVVVE